MDYLLGVIFALVVQWIATCLTATKSWSKQAMIRNTAFAASCVAVSHHVTPAIFLLNLVLEFTMDVTNYYFFSIDPWITTKYLYNDFFEGFVNKRAKGLQYYTEGAYSQILGVDTTNLERANRDRVIQYGLSIFKQAKKGRSFLLHSDGKTELDIDWVLRQSQKDKYEYMAQKCGVRPGTRVLEIGFGKLDLMQTFRGMGAHVTGVNLSIEQVHRARKEGFKAICCNFWDMPKKIEEIGRDYDVVISNGSLEYYRLSFQPESEVYNQVFGVAQLFLKPGGVYMCTTIHSSYNFRPSFLGYLLWAGNDGSYPGGRDGLTKSAKTAGLRVVSQENRWLDYYLYSCAWVALYRKEFGQILRDWQTLLRWVPLLFAAPHFAQSLITYGFLFNRPHWNPWLWQFLPKGDYVPMTHEWILFEKPLSK